MVGPGASLRGKGQGTPDQRPSCPPPCAPHTGYQIAYRLASSSPNTFTTVEVGATVRQFTATELAPESAYIFRLSAKTRQGWGEPLEATVITTEKRGETLRPRVGGGRLERAAEAPPSGPTCLSAGGGLQELSIY